MLYLGNARVIANFIFGGILERFPRLQLVSVESGVGWIPFFLQALDWQMVETAPRLHETFSLTPTEYFRRQCFLSVEADEEPARQYIEWFGDGNLVFSTDFPHGDSKYPHAVEAFAKLPIPEASQRRIVGENWSRLYGIPLRRHAPRR